MISDFDQPSSDDSLMDASARHEPTSVDAAYARCDPSFAQTWLDRSGLDITQVARMSCLSVAQVRQLLQGTDASFYSATIKQRAYRRVLALLGAPQPELVGAFQAPAPDAAEPSPEPAHAGHRTVGMAPRGSTTHSAWAWLGLALLLGAATAPWWQGWWHTPVRSLRPQIDAQAPAEAAPPVTPAVEAASPDVSPPPQETQTTSPPPGNGATAQAAETLSAPPCAYVAQPVTTVMPAVAEKPGNYVYVQALREAEVCVIDGDRKVTHLQLKAGERRSVYGPPPWQLSGLDLGQLHIYFQGWRVLLPEMATQQVALVERSR